MRDLKLAAIVGLVAGSGALSLVACSPGPAAEPPAAVCQQTIGEHDGIEDIYIYITTSDHNGATKDMESVFERNLSKFEDYELHFERVSSIEDMKESMQHAYETEGDIDAMILAFHGSRSRMSFGWESLSMGNAESRLAGYDSCLADDARILLYSCSVGAESESGNLALTLNEVLEADVDAPKSTLIPPDDPGVEWEDQFALDEDGLLTYAYSNWAGYDKVRFKGKNYWGAVAPLSYADRSSSELWPEEEYDFEDLFLILRE